MDTVDRLINQTQIRWALIHYEGCSNGHTGFYRLDQTVKCNDYYDLKNIFLISNVIKMLKKKSYKDAIKMFRAVLFLLIKIKIILVINF